MNCELKEEASDISRAFSNAWSFDGRDLERPSAEQLLNNLVEKSTEAHRARLREEFFGLGPLQSLVDDDSVLEIVINGPHEILFEKAGRLQQLQDEFLSQNTFNSFVAKICREARIKVDLAQPFADGRWQNFRIHIGCFPLTHCSHHITLRRVSASRWTLEQLQSLDWATPKQIEIMRKLIHERKNLLFVGPTGCGKTTALGACLASLPETERTVIIEDTDELHRPNLASTKLLTRAQGSESLPEVSLDVLVRQSLRMRPQRLVMGEVRSGEAKDLLLALATGHSGSMGTLHASDARQALLRLEMLVQLGAPQWNVLAIRQLIHLSVEALVVCGFQNGKRQLEGIFKVAALESIGFLLEPLA